jgi:hypothetical protein
MDSTARYLHWFAALACVVIAACGGGGSGGVASPPADTTAPTVASASPAPASGMNAPTTSIVVSFSEPVDCSSVNASTIALSEGSTPLAGTTVCSGNTITFSPALSLPTNATLTATVNTPVVDLSSNALASPYTWSFGVASWTRQVGTPRIDVARAFAIDKAGNLYVAGSTEGNFEGGVAGNFAVLVKYDKLGTRQWIRQLVGSASAVATDDAGNIYVGLQTVSGTGWTGAMAKYDSSGAQLWVHPLQSQLFWTMATGSQGNVLAAGSRNGSAGSFVAKYDGDGTLLWENNDATNYLRSIAADSDGNVYAAGGSGGWSWTENNNAVLVKYDSSGASQWARPFGAGASTLSWAKAVAVDSNGDPYVAGFTNGLLDGSPNDGPAFVAKFDPLGTNLWTRQMGDAEAAARLIQLGLHVEVGATSLAVDAADNVVVGGATCCDFDGYQNHGVFPDGTSWHGYESDDPFFVKYDSAGTKLWSRLDGSSRHESLVGVGIDAAGNIYGAGSTTGGMDGNVNAGYDDFYIVKYQADGTKR